MRVTAVSLLLQEPFDVLWRGPIAAWLVACTLLAAHTFARRIEPQALLLERWAATATAGMWLAALGFHVLAPLQAFSPWWAVPGAGLLGALALLLDRRAPHALGRDLRALVRLAGRALRGRERAWVLALGLGALPVLLRPLLAPPLGWDALTLHAFEAGAWAQQCGTVAFDAPGPWFAHGTRWLGSAVLTSWAMLPFQSDLLATFAEALQWLLLGLTLTALARALGVREPLASAVAAFALALPTLRLLVGSGYAEPAACLAFVAACLFGVRHVLTRRAGYLVLALAALGLAVQMKQSFLRSCAALGLALVVSALWRSPLRQALRALALGALLAGLVIGPWMVRSLELYGLPLSPLPVTLFGVTLGQAPPELQWYLDRPTLQRGWDAELHTLATLFGDLGQGREVPTLLMLLPLALLPLGLARGLRRRAAQVLLLAPALVADVVTFASQELAPVRLRYMHTSARFLLFALLLAVVLSALAPRTRVGARVYAHALRGASLLLLALYASVGWSAEGALAAVAVLSVLAVLTALTALLLRRRARLAGPALALVLLVLLVALDATRSALRYPLFRNAFAVHAVPTFWVDAAQALDDPAHPRRIAVTGGAQQDLDRWFTYAFLGRRLQNELLYVTPQGDGRIRHFGLDPLLADFDRGVDAAAWLRALGRARITHVVTFDPPSIELAIIQANPQRFARVSSPGFQAFGVFALLPAGRPHP